MKSMPQFVTRQKSILIVIITSFQSNFVLLTSRRNLIGSIKKDVTWPALQSYHAELGMKANFDGH